jgi:hypothetical protein
MAMARTKKTTMGTNGIQRALVDRVSFPGGAWAFGYYKSRRGWAKRYVGGHCNELRQIFMQEGSGDKFIGELGDVP